MKRLNKAEEIELMKNLCLKFSKDEKKTDKKAKKRYQKLIATKGLAISITLGEKPKAKILVKKLAKKLTKIHNKKTMLEK